MTVATPAADTAAVAEEMGKGLRKPMPADGVDAALVSQLVARAREQGLQLIGDGGMQSLAARASPTRWERRSRTILGGRG